MTITQIILVAMGLFVVFFGIRVFLHRAGR